MVERINKEVDKLKQQIKKIPYKGIFLNPFIDTNLPTSDLAEICSGICREAWLALDDLSEEIMNGTFEQYQPPSSPKKN